jgi:hypothetical protein
MLFEAAGNLAAFFVCIRVYLTACRIAIEVCER